LERDGGNHGDSDFARSVLFSLLRLTVTDRITPFTGHTTRECTTLGQVEFMRSEDPTAVKCLSTNLAGAKLYIALILDE
jgi:hypothetical protein